MTLPRYPVFIPSKNRAQYRYTSKSFEAIGLPHREVVEEDDVEKYERAGSKNLLIMPQHNEGLVRTRNWIWDHAESIGTKRFWTFDDNIQGLYRFNKNLKVPCSTPTPLAVIEDFTERYTNVPISGMNYHMFASRKCGGHKPFTLNTRVYSNMLIDTFAKNPSGKKYRNEGFFNDDTDLCLRVLKDGFCTLLFNAFLIYKTTTMACKGGMTSHYVGDGRYKMAKELADKHPDVARVSVKWGRYQHHVDYSGFRNNRLIKRGETEGLTVVNNYGMELKPFTKKSSND